MLAHLRRLFEDGALSTACPVTCIRFDDADGCRPHALAPCGHVVASAALQRPGARSRCPVPTCQAPRITAGGGGALPPVDRAALERAKARAGASARPVELPVLVNENHICVDSVVGHGRYGHVAHATWTPPGERSRRVARECVTVGQDAYVRRCAMRALMNATLASRHSRRACPVYGYYFTDAPAAGGRQLCALLERCDDTLAAAVERDGPLPPARAARVCGELAAGLAELHAALRLWHLAVRPEHVLLAASGAPLLVGWAVAAQAGTNVTSLLPVAAGADPFAAPEHRANARVNESADVYGLGRTLAFALTGSPELPRSGSGSSGGGGSGGVPQELAALVREMTQNDASSRPCMADVAARLRPPAPEAAPMPVRILPRCTPALHNSNENVNSLVGLLADCKLV